MKTRFVVNKESQEVYLDQTANLIQGFEGLKSIKHCKNLCFLALCFILFASYLQTLGVTATCSDRSTMLRM